FGKGTVQTIQPLNHGELKLTLAKFYRVSGQSTQHQGVIPDISYPADVDTKEIGESSLPEALPWDSIRAAINPEMNPFKPFLTELKARHDARTQADPDFVFTRDRLALTQELMNETSVSLNEQKRRAQQAEVERRQLALENALRQAKGEAPLAKLETDEEEAAAHADTERVEPEKDAYLAESGRILIDYLGLASAMAKH
ncbi:MAG TPA: tail-specific protease, partial [Pseudomonas sp.]|nr:tail-specific protease [Pseudomonas sp.]